MEPPPQPFSFAPVDIPEAIPEAEEEETVEEMVTDSPNDNDHDDLMQGGKPKRIAPSLPPRVSIYSRQPLSPIYSPDQTNNPSFPSNGNNSTPPPRRLLASTWLPSTSSSNGPSESPTAYAETSSSSEAGAGGASPPQSPSAAGFAKRIVPMSTGGQTVAIPGAYSPKRVTQTFTGNGAASASGSPIRPNYTGQGPFNNGSPNRIKPNFTGGSWSPSAAAAQRVECPRCGKAVYHAEQVC